MFQFAMMYKLFVYVNGEKKNVYINAKPSAHIQNIIEMLNCITKVAYKFYFSDEVKLLLKIETTQISSFN